MRPFKTHVSLCQTSPTFCLCVAPACAYRRKLCANIVSALDSTPLQDLDKVGPHISRIVQEIIVVPSYYAVIEKAIFEDLFSFYAKLLQ